MKTKKSLKRTAALGLLSFGILFSTGYATAYLTDSEQHTNVFTVGDVTIDLLEKKYDALSASEKSSLVSNQVVPKDPVVENTGTNDAVVFLKLTVPVRNVTKIEDNGIKGTKQNQEIFYFESGEMAKGQEANVFEGKWIELDNKEAGTDHSTATRTYVFGYHTKLEGSADDGSPQTAANRITSSLFDYVQLKNVIEDELTASQLQKIKVEAFAIQASDILHTVSGRKETIDLSGEISYDTLSEIYDIFINQGTKVTSNSNEMEPDDRVSEADISNVKDLGDDGSKDAAGREAH